MPTYPRQPDSLEALKKILVPGGDYVSSGVAENDPELMLPQARSNADFEGNNRLKQVLGLGPSPLIQQQRKDLTAQDEAVNAARIAANPEVGAEADKLQKEKLALAGEPNRVAGQSNLALQQNQQQATKDLIESVGQGTGGGQSGAMRMSINAKGEPSFAPPAPMGQMEQQLVDAAHGIAALGIPLLSKFEAKYPGISTDPKKYGNVFTDTVGPKIGKAAYIFGGMTDSDELLQESAAIQAWGMRSLMSGRINQKMMDIINAHLPQPGFSPGANYDRLHRLITDVLPAQLQGVSEGRGGQPYTLQQPQSDPYKDPNWGKQ